MKQLKFICILFLLLFSKFVDAQLVDNFGDGDFTNNPSWSGDVASFIVNPNKELQLNAAAGGVAQLYTNLETKDSMRWEMYVRLAFAPSATNRLRIFLVSDSTSLIDGNGYYIEIGDDGATDAIKLYSKKNGTPNLLVSGTAGAVSTDPSTVRIIVTKTKSHLWTLKADLTGTTNYQKEFDYQDNGNNWKNGSQYFGFQCVYTVTRKDKFYFDDIKADGFIPIDKTPPIIISVIPSDNDNKVLTVNFDENISPITANTIQNYLLDNSLKPLTAVLNSNNQSVTLTFVSDIVIGTHTLLITNIADIVGNSNPSQSVSFTKSSNLYPKKYEVIINEIMADPTPVVGLPDAEWVELYNRSKQDFNLKSMSLKSGNSIYALPDYNLVAGGYVVICALAKKALFAPLTNVISIATFPALTNTGDEVSIIENKNLDIIDQVIYSDDWYSDNIKKNGGFTLELINPNAICNLSANWTATSDLRGGSPGQKNTVTNTNTDIGFDIISIVTSSPNSIDVVFNKKVGNISITDLSVTGLPISNIEYLSSFTLKIRFSNDLEKGKIYNLLTKNTFSICDGTKLSEVVEKKFGLSERPKAKDIIINEVLFNPNTNASRYVELYNNSNKIVNIKDLSLGSFVFQTLESYKIDTNFSLYPGDFVVLTDNISGVTGYYFLKNKNQILKVKLPKMNDDGANISILLNELLGVTVLDSFQYSKTLQNPLIDILDGVSIERVNYNANTNDPNNWQSAASTVGYGTPTYKNSQYRDAGTSTSSISLINTTFSPDGDSNQDFLTIQYNLKNSATGSFWVYDPNGRLVKTISKNTFLAAEGNIVWNGDTDEGIKAPVGVYTIYAELIMDSGTVEKTFKNCVLAAKF
jgi:hypothetical protein